MAQHYLSIYRFLENQAFTSARFNTNSQDIDLRLDALEEHVASDGNPHGLTAEDLLASLESHTHGTYEHVALCVQGGVATGDHGPRPLVLRGATVAAVGAAVDAVSTSGPITVDVLRSGDHGVTWTSLLSTPITIEEGDYSSAQAAVQPVIVVSSIAVNARLRMNVEAAGVDATNLQTTILLTRCVPVD